MAQLADKQREALIENHGEPIMRIEYDVFANGEVSQWTHFNHEDDFEEMKKHLIAVREHLTAFIGDGNLCPFNKAAQKHLSDKINADKS